MCQFISLFTFLTVLQKVSMYWLVPVAVLLAVSAGLLHANAVIVVLGKVIYQLGELENVVSAAIHLLGIFNGLLVAFKVFLGALIDLIE